jgi:hypothetical protein
MWTSNAYAFVNLNANPFQRFCNVLFGPGNVTGLIRIFYTKNHSAMVLPGEQKVKQGGS